jgi:hypothetical protein
MGVLTGGRGVKGQPEIGVDQRVSASRGGGAQSWARRGAAEVAGARSVWLRPL